MPRLLVLVAGIASPAVAQCLTADSLKAGITVKRADQSMGHVHSAGRGVVVDCVANKNGGYDTRRVTAGVYETGFAARLSDAAVVGGTVPDFKWQFRAKLDSLAASQSLSGTVRQVESLTGFGAMLVALPCLRASDIAATDTDLTETPAKPSGGTCRILPVETTFAAQDGPRARRWLWFPDLGFVLQTRGDGVANGRIALTGA